MVAEMTSHVGGLMLLWFVDRIRSIAHEVFCEAIRFGTLIRYYFCNIDFFCTLTCTRIALSFGIVMPPGPSGCISLIGLTPKLCAADLRARLAAVTLATVAASTHDRLFTAKGAQKESGTGKHRQKMPMSAGFNPH